MGTECFTQQARNCQPIQQLHVLLAAGHRTHNCGFILRQGTAT